VKSGRYIRAPEPEGRCPSLPFAVLPSRKRLISNAGVCAVLRFSPDYIRPICAVRSVAQRGGAATGDVPRPSWPCSGTGGTPVAQEVAGSENFLLRKQEFTGWQSRPPPLRSAALTSTRAIKSEGAPVVEICVFFATEEPRTSKAEARATMARAPLAFATMFLLESAPRESFTGAHEDLPHLPANLLR